MNTNSNTSSPQWVEREYVVSVANWQMELHELISTYILTCRQRGQGGPVRRGRFIRIETSVDDDNGYHFDGPEIRVPMSSVCAECFRCCRRYMIEPLVPFFERHFPNSHVLVIKIHYGVEDEKLPHASEVEGDLDAMWAANLQALHVDEHGDGQPDLIDSVETEMDMKIGEDEVDDEDSSGDDDEDADGK